MSTLLLFLYFFFLIFSFGHLGHQSAFALIVLVSLRLIIINDSPPSPITILYVYHRFCFLPRQVTHVCFYPDA